MHESLIEQAMPAAQRVFYREPRAQEPHRWVRHVIGGRTYSVVQPVTFTPYAAVRPCSARCRFCSENLRERASAKHASLYRPADDYFECLRKALRELEGLPLSYSLSGLENTDDPDWFVELLESLSAHTMASRVEERVLYTNLSGLVAGQANKDLWQAVASFAFTRFEVSRHHYQDQINQRLMRFRNGLPVRGNGAFERTLSALNEISAIKLVCIVQKGGVERVEDVRAYLSWAKSLGIRDVIFREMSFLGDGYLNNGTYRYVLDHRVSVADLYQSLCRELASDGPARVVSATRGYYFENVQMLLDGVRVTFEHSDYREMHSKHDSGEVYKLVFHANGNLCADWSPNRHVLLGTDTGAYT